MNMQDVDKVIADILTGGTTAAAPVGVTGGVTSVTGGVSGGAVAVKGGRSRSRSRSRSSRSRSSRRKSHGGNSVTFGKINLHFRGGEDTPSQPVVGGFSDVVKNLDGGKVVGGKVAGGKVVGGKVVGGKVAGGKSPMRGGETAPESAPVAEVTGGSAEVAEVSADIEGGKKRRLPEVLRIRNSKVKKLYLEMKSKPKYRNVPGNILYGKAMKMV